MRVGVLFSRIRPEEKLIMEALDERGVDYEMIDVRQAVFDLSHYDEWKRYSVVLERCVSHSQALTSLDILGYWGIPCVNQAAVADICGDKRKTTQALISMGVPTPQVRIAYTVESALAAIEQMGFPVVLKPVVGSWGRLLARVNDINSAEAVLNHKAALGSIQHSIFYIQEYVEKGGQDIRTFVVGDETICGITRTSEHWITNTARGGKAANFPITDEIDHLSRAAARAVGGGVLAVDIMQTPSNGYVVNEVNYTMEFRNSIKPTGVNIPARIIDFVINVGDGMAVPMHAGRYQQEIPE